MESMCCGATPVDEVDQNNMGFCSCCKEHAFFTSEFIEEIEE